MSTVTDVKEYSSSNPQKTVTIKGEAGKQIKIEEVSLRLISGKDKVLNTTTVYVNGNPYAAWKYTSAKYSDVLTYNKYPFVVDEGKDAVLTWSVVTENKSYSAKMKQASYTFSYVDVEKEDPVEETPVEEKDGFLVIKCKESAVSELLPILKEIAPNAEINKLSQVEQ